MSVGMEASMKREIGGEKERRGGEKREKYRRKND